MFTRKKEATLIDREIDRALLVLQGYAPYSQEYTTTMDHLTTLYGMKKTETSSSVSKDTMAVVGGNLLGIVLILKHESVNVITSKAMGLLIKPRV